MGAYYQQKEDNNINAVHLSLSFKINICIQLFHQQIMMVREENVNCIDDNQVELRTVEDAVRKE